MRYLMLLPRVQLNADVAVVGGMSLLAARKSELGQRTHFWQAGILLSGILPWKLNVSAALAGWRPVLQTSLHLPWSACERRVWWVGM